MGRLIDKFAEKAVEVLFGHRVIRWLSIAALVIALALVLRRDAAIWDDVSRQATSVKRFVTDNLAVQIGLAVAVAGYAIWIPLVLHSHKRWRDDADDADVNRSYRAEGLNCTVVLQERWNSTQHEFERGVLIENTGGEALRAVNGRVRLYFGNTRTSELPFEVTELEPGGRAIARRFEASDLTGYWDRFDAFIDSLVSETDARARIVQTGPRRMLNLTSFGRLRLRRAFWPRRRRYDTWWLESGIRRTVWPRIRYRMLGPDAFREQIWMEQLPSGATRFHRHVTRTWRRRARRAVGRLGLVVGLAILCGLAGLAAFAVGGVVAKTVLAAATVLVHFLEREFG
jgi:hypothetical protein